MKMEEQRLSEHRSALEVEKTSMIAEQSKVKPFKKIRFKKEGERI